MNQVVTVVGAGLAGCEVAFQLARRGISVKLIEMKPLKKTPAQNSDRIAELVCSNSLRLKSPLNAVGLIKEEMKRLGSLIIDAAFDASVPAGDALAVDREKFSDAVERRLQMTQKVERVNEVVTALPPADAGPVVIATGPLTDEALALDIAKIAGDKRLYFYDAIAPIVSAESLDLEKIYPAARYDKGEATDYLNCPMSKEEYEAFLSALLEAECAPLHDFEQPKFFEGCLPVEVTASRGPETLRFGCMKPVGLINPRTGAIPHAVVQLRKEDRDGQAYNLVGFQTKLKYPDQKRVLKMIPGLEEAVFLRLGALHRNTYLDAPSLLDEHMCLKAAPHVRFAGQMTGVEGYVESAAHGMMVGLTLAHELLEARFGPPPRTTALGGLWSHVRGTHRADPRRYEPQNVNWSMLEPTDVGVKKRNRKRARTVRAQTELERWAETAGLELGPRSYEASDIPEVPGKKRRRNRPAVSPEV